MRTFAIDETTTDKQVDENIPFADMREFAKEFRDELTTYAGAIEDKASTAGGPAIALYEFNQYIGPTVFVLYDHVYSSAMVNTAGSGVGNSHSFTAGRIKSPKHAAACYVSGVAAADPGAALMLEFTKEGEHRFAQFLTNFSEESGLELDRKVCLHDCLWSLEEGIEQGNPTANWELTPPDRSRTAIFEAELGIDLIVSAKHRVFKS